MCQKRLYKRSFALHAVRPLQRTPGYRLKSPLQREPEIQSRAISQLFLTWSTARFVCTRARKGGVLGPWRLGPLQRGYGTPPCPAQPTRSRLGAARSFPRPRSRVAEIAAHACHTCNVATRPPRGPRPPPSVLHAHTPHCGTRHHRRRRWRAPSASCSGCCSPASHRSSRLGSARKRRGGSLALTCTPTGCGKQVRVRQENHGPKVGAVHGQSRLR